MMGVDMAERADARRPFFFLTSHTIGWMDGWVADMDIRMDGWMDVWFMMDSCHDAISAWPDPAGNQVVITNR
jgi:hypothetical protein